MRLNGFDLNQLVCLQALLNECSVTRAAERVHLSQSAMSWVLAQLREHFGDPLLVRSGRQLVPTPFARTLAGPVSELLLRAQSVTARSPQQALASIERELKIVASDYVMAAALTPTIQAVMKSMPGLRFDILPLSPNSARLLAMGEIDLLCAGQQLDVGAPPNQLLFEDQSVCLVCARNGPPGESVTREEYLSRPQLVLRYFENQMTFEDEEAVRREGLTRQRRVAVWSHSLVPQMVCGTPMVATISSRTARQFEENWPVKVLPFPFEQNRQRVYAYWHASRSEDPVLKEFMRVATEEVVSPLPCS